jgi:hypothetical protein
MGDGPEMLLWRATVNPLKNIGSPISAEWQYHGDLPNTADENRSSIRQAVVREMVLTYPDGGEGYWIPGEAVETVYFPYFPEDSNQSWHAEIPGPDFDYYEVEHSTSIPLGTGYNSQYVRPSYYDMENAANLMVELVRAITRDLYGKGKKYIRGYVNRYFVTPTISDEFTAEADKDARNIIVGIFLEANTLRQDEVEDFVEDEWERVIRDNELFNFIFFNENLYMDNLSVRRLNKKGKYIRPANKAEVIKFIDEGIQYTPTFKLPPSPNSKPITRKRSQRRRDVKIIKNERRFLESIKDNPHAMYGDDALDRLHLDKMKRLGQELREKVRDKTEKSELIKSMYGRGLRTTRRRKYKRTTCKFRGKKQIK